MQLPKVQFRLSRLDSGIALCTALTAFALYTRTLYPDLLPGDSGEFQTLAYLLAHTHPTGYDVYLVLARLFILLPVGSIAYRVNLFSAWMAGLTVGGVYLAGTLLSGRRWAGLLAATALAVSASFWSQAVIAEVYTTGSFFVVLILLCILLWDQTKRRLFLGLAAALGVLSLGVHMSVALIAPAVAVYLLLNWKDWPRVWKSVSTGLFIGVWLYGAVFLQTDINSGPESYFNTTVRAGLSLWNMTPSDVNTPWERLTWGFKVVQFRQFMFTDPKTVMPEQAAGYWKALPDEFSKPVIGLAVLGLAVVCFRQWRVGLLLVLALAGQYLYTFNYPIWDFYVFYIPSYVLLALFSSAGIGILLDLLQRLPARLGQILQPVLGLVLISLAVWPFLPQRLSMVKAGKPEFPYDPYPVNWVNEGYHVTISRIAAALDKNAMLFTDWGKIYPLFYAARIEQGRDDLQILETYPQDESLGISQSELEMIKENIDSHLIYFDTYPDELIKAGYRLAAVWRGPIKLYKVVK